MKSKGEIQMVKTLYRYYREIENINPDMSITHIRGTTFNVFNEATGQDLGNHHRVNIQSYGFSRRQLDFVKNNGTTNFVRISKRE